MGRINHILIVDDDRELVELVRQYLEGEGFVVAAAADYSSGLRAALSGNHELVILDVTLPGGSGFELLKRLRAESNLPVVLLTARGDSVDRIVGLQIGADDYVPKPFEPRELVARIHAVLRRTRAGMASGGSEDSVVVGDVTLSPRTRTAMLSGQVLDLTTMEFDLLEVLLRSAGKIVTRDQLAQAALGRKLAPFDRGVDIHLSKLRKKLGGGHYSQDRIKTVRGSGYIYVALERKAGLL
ncbi:MAG TPA: response regulator transcription factor [Acidobacteriaceae bacterium]|jgi:two-component system response regulator CpxR